METVHYIHYYDQFGTVQKVQFSKVFDMWVDYHGGKRQFLESLQKASGALLYNGDLLTMAFETYFKYTFKGEYILDDPNIDQDHLYNVEFFKMYLRRVADDYENRPFNPRSIITLVIVFLAVLGLISMCKS